MRLRMESEEARCKTEIRFSIVNLIQIDKLDLLTFTQIERRCLLMVPPTLQQQQLNGRTEAYSPSDGGEALRSGAVGRRHITELRRSSGPQAAAQHLPGACKTTAVNRNRNEGRAHTRCLVGQWHYAAAAVRRRRETVLPRSCGPHAALVCRTHAKRRRPTATEIKDMGFGVAH